MKKFVVPVVVAVVVIAAVVYLMQSQTFKQKSGNKQQLSQSEQTSGTFDPKNPNFVLGTVTQVSPSELEFKSGTATDTAKISSSTKLVKQVKVGTEVKVVDATISDFKVGKLVVVYFTSPAQKGVYTADKIQIIGQ